jgi:hypothetical protein
VVNFGRRESTHKYSNAPWRSVCQLSWLWLGFFIQEEHHIPTYSGKRGIRMPRSKRENQIRHARRRARERFGLNATHLQQLEKDIQNQKCQLLERQSGIRTVWYTVVEEIEVVAVYDSCRNVVVTLIPFSWWKENHKCPDLNVGQTTNPLSHLPT